MESQPPPPPAAAAVMKPKLSSPSPSFRLNSPSLNTIRLRRVFDLFDSNGDGEITADELGGALNRLGLGVEASDLADLLSSHVLPGHTGLGFDEFQGLHRALGDALFGGGGTTAAAEEEAEMAEAFRVFDEDGDGYISAKELQAVLGKLGLREGEDMESVRQMIWSVDRDRDGRVDFPEFKHMMHGIAVDSC